MISRTTFCSAQAAMMRPARTGPMPFTSRRRSGSASMTSNTFSLKAFSRGRNSNLQWSTYAYTFFFWQLGH